MSHGATSRRTTNWRRSRALPGRSASAPRISVLCARLRLQNHEPKWKRFGDVNLKCRTSVFGCIFLLLDLDFHLDQVADMGEDRRDGPLRKRRPVRAECILVRQTFRHRGQGATRSAFGSSSNTAIPVVPGPFSSSDTSTSSQRHERPWRNGDQSAPLRTRSPSAVHHIAGSVRNDDDPTPGPGVPRSMLDEPGVDVILLKRQQGTKHAFADFRSVGGEPAIDPIRRSGPATRFGKNLVKLLAVPAQCGCNHSHKSQRRNWLSESKLKCRSNVCTVRPIRCRTRRSGFSKCPFWWARKVRGRTPVVLTGKRDDDDSTEPPRGPGRR